MPVAPAPTAAVVQQSIAEQKYAGEELLSGSAVVEVYQARSPLLAFGRLGCANSATRTYPQVRGTERAPLAKDHLTIVKVQPNFFAKPKLIIKVSPCSNMRSLRTARPLISECGSSMYH